jgi:hypothetical protein
MSGARAHGSLTRLHPTPGQEQAVEAHLSEWHRTAGRTLPGTRLHLLLDLPATGELLSLHLFERAAAFRRALASTEQRDWEAALAALLSSPPDAQEVAVRWNAATDARPRVSVSIDQDVHAAVQDLIGRLLERHPRTPGEDSYLAMLQSVAEEYERDFPTTAPTEEELR